MLAGMTETEGMTEEDMTGTGGMIEAMIGTDVTIGAPTGTVAMTETEETTVATTGTAGMVIVAPTERTIVGTATVMMTAAVSATAEMTMTEEMMGGGRIGEVRKRRRVIGMGKRREAPRKLLLRRA